MVLEQQKKLSFLLCLSSGTDNRPGEAADYISCPLKVLRFKDTVILQLY